ncbi:MAG: hypothetical protein LKJ69_11650 [Lactobacillus sp.]|nr:hypothetical protein [Lactobacillus sp.]MCI2034019.1 hypothetical protein [Lactobacillus sp.]
MADKWRLVGLLVIIAGLLGGLWWCLRAPLPNPLIGGGLAVCLGVAVTLLFVGSWRRH